MTNEENKGAFKTGDRVSGERPIAGTVRVVGTFEDDGSSLPYVFVNGQYLCVMRDSLRHEPAEQKARFYGERPKVLPKTLPAGVRWNQGGQTGLFLCPAKLSGGVYQGLSSRDGRDDLNASIMSDSIDWTTVPIQEDPPPARASADVGPPPAVDWSKTCCQCGCARDDHSPTCSYFKKPAEPGRADPYAEHRRNKYGLGTGTYESVSQLESEIHEAQLLSDAKRLSAMTLRERRKSEALRMIDRPMVAPKHPVMWPEGSEYKEQV